MNVNRLITCPACRQRFTQPKVLPCQHTYCQHCVQSLLDVDVIKCPECSVEHSLPEDGIAGFHDNPTVLGLLEIVAAHGDEQCPDCGKLSLIVTCEHCTREVCSNCCSEHGRLSAKLGESLGTLLFAMTSRDNSQRIRRNRDLFDNAITALADEKTRVSRVFIKHRQDLENREKTMIKYLWFIEKTWKLTLENSADDNGTLSENTRRELGEIVDSCTSVDKLTDVTKMIDSLVCITLAMSAEEPGFGHNTQFTFHSEQEKFTEVIEKYGRMKMKNTDLSFSMISSAGQPLLNRMLRTMNSLLSEQNEDELTEVIGDVEQAVSPSAPPEYSVARAMELSSEPSAPPDAISVGSESDYFVPPNDLPPPTYMSLFPSEEVAPPQELCSNSIADLRYKNKRVTKPRFVTALGRPMGVAYCRDTRMLFIVDNRSGNIFVSNIYGSHHLLKCGGSIVHVPLPKDICIGRDKLYITSSGDQKVHVLSKQSAEKLYEFPDRKLRSIGCIVYHNELILVGDKGGILIFREDTRLIGRIGPGYVTNPLNFDVGPDNLLYVTDWNGSVSDVCVFTFESRLVTRFGAGPLPAWGVAVDGEGYVCVARRGRVDVYRPEHEVLCIFHLGKNSSRDSVDPYGLCILPEGQIITSDWSNGRLQIF